VTFWDLLALLRRRWPVTVIGVLLTVGVVALVALRPPVYYTRVQLTILPPAAVPGNAFTIETYALIGVAGAVAEVIGSPENGATDVPGTAELTGTGVRDGFSVRLPNIGGQWSVGYEGPYLDVQAIGPTPEVVRGYVDDVRAQVDGLLLEWQTAAGVESTDLLRTQLSPTDPVILDSRGSPMRAIAIVLLLGAGFTVVADIGTDRLVARQLPRPPPRHGRGGRGADAGTGAGVAEPGAGSGPGTGATPDAVAAEPGRPGAAGVATSGV
jgi:hypothetical protein